MSFQLSPAVDSSKVFLAQWSELFQRFDPEMVRYRRKTHSFKYPMQRLNEVLITAPQYGANESGKARETFDEPRYVRITDIDEHGNLTPELGATASNLEARYQLQENDLLIARSGSVGKSYLHKTERVPYPCFFAGYLLRFRFKPNLVLPDYVFAWTQLPIYKAWVSAVQRRAVQPNINAQEYASLELPIPPLPIQAQIVAQLHDAHETKRRKDAHAR